MDQGGASLFERDRELSAISNAVSRLTDGISSILVIEGPAGIGKTALAAAMVIVAAAAGLRVLRGRAIEIERHLPFAAFGWGSVGSGSAASGSAASGSAGRSPAARIAEVVAGGPVVVVVDDLHWADRASLGLLQQLVRGCGHRPVAIVLTLRPQPRSPALTALLVAADQHGAEVLRPAPLSPSAVAELAERTAGMPVGERLRESLLELGGNPLAVEQVVRGMLSDDALAPDASGFLEQSTGEPLPTTRASIRQSVRSLGPSTFELLGLVSILGSSCPPADLDLMTNRPPASVRDDLAEARAAGFLTAASEVGEQRAQVAFRHDLIHEAFYDDLPLAVRRALHADAAAVLEAAEAPAAVVAEHVIRAAAGDGAAVGRLRRATSAAVEIGATAVAADLIAAALESGAVDDTHYRELAAELPADGDD